MPRFKVYARILMTPMHAKLLHLALGENPAKFEDGYGEIKPLRMDFRRKDTMGSVGSSYRE